MKIRLLKLLDATLGAMLCRLFALLAYLRRDASAESTARLPQVHRILLIRPGGMGDMVILVPVLRVLRASFPAAVIDVACEKRNLAILEIFNTGVNSLCYDANPMSFLMKLLRARYDVAIDSEQFHNMSAVFCYMSGAAFRIGFRVNPLRNPLYTHLIDYDLSGPEVLQFQRLLEPLGIGGKRDEGDATTADTVTVRVDVPPVFAVIHPGATTRYKQWPSDRFAELARKLNNEQHLEIVLLGAETLPGMPSGPGIHNLLGRTSLAEASEIIRRATLFVGTDSGLSHLAAAHGTKAVVLFGPSDSAKWGYTNSNSRVIRNITPCSPCFMLGYHRPCRNIECMNGITVSVVFQACCDLLRQASRVSMQTSKEP